MGLSGRGGCCWALMLACVAPSSFTAEGAIVGVTSDIEGVTDAVIETWRRGATIVREATTAHKITPPLRFSVDAQTQWAWEPAIASMNCGNNQAQPPTPPPPLPGFPGAANQSLMDVTMSIVDEVILMDYGGGAIVNWLARAWPWFARSRVGWSLSNRTRTVLVVRAAAPSLPPLPKPQRGCCCCQSLGLEAGPTNPGLDTELDVENYLNETASAALMGYRVDGPTRY